MCLAHLIWESGSVLKFNYTFCAYSLGYIFPFFCPVVPQVHTSWRRFKIRQDRKVLGSGLQWQPWSMVCLWHWLGNRSSHDACPHYLMKESKRAWSLRGLPRPSTQETRSSFLSTLDRWAYMKILRFEVLMAKISVFVFWILVPCGLLGRDQHFGGTYCLHLHSTLLLPSCVPCVCLIYNILYIARQQMLWVNEISF
jgi:hypothetical protein